MAPPRKRIMIVEDEALIALDLERRLLSLGYDVVGTADHFEEALEVIESGRPDLVLMDVHIRGERDGIDVAYALRESHDTPVVFVTAYNDDQTVARATAASPYGYLIKPFDDRTLLVNISIALERHASDRRMRLYSAALTSATVGVVFVEHSEGTPEVTFANEAYLCLYGESLSEIEGKEHRVKASSSSSGQAEQILTAIRERRATQEVIEWTNASGQTCWSSVVVSPVENKRSRDQATLVFHLDVTRENEAERGLAQKQRLELIGQLSAGIAHDFNNVLGAIIPLSEMAQEAPTVEDCRADLREITYAARSGARLTRKLLDMSRPEGTSRSDSAEVSKVVRDSRGMIERLVGHGIEVDIQLDPQPMYITCDETALEQILLNLITNARDAMSGEGRIEIRASVQMPEEHGSMYRPLVRLEVQDSGSGIDDETVARIFEPFFTTKAPGLGTGLGLATTKKLVEGANGAVSVESQIGQGTTFVLDFPTASAVSKAPEEDLGVPSLHERDQLCLLVEDEPTLRRTYGRALTSAGFDVIEASTGEQGIAIATERADELRLVVTDMVLPGISGSDVYQQASDVAPNAALLVITGYFDDTASNLPADASVLWKPFSTSVLVRAAVRAVETGTRSAPPEITETPPVPPRVRISEVAQSPVPTEAPSEGPPILLLDDDEQLRTVLRRALELKGHRVIEAASADAALRVGAETEPSLVIFDINLPDGNGFEVLERMRTHHANLPSLVMSGGLSNEDVRRAFDGHVIGFLAKPVSVTDFLKEVERCLKEGAIAKLRRELLLSKAPQSILEDITTTERQLAESIDDLYVVFQPIVRAYDLSVFAYEALLRSNGPLKYPDRILVAAEVLGQVDRLGRAIRGKIADTLEKRRDVTEPIFVNLHPSELRLDLLLAPDEPLKRWTSRIVLEVTERAQLSTSGASLTETLHALHEARYRVALDDLGEGYAGLSWLVRMTPHFAKLDMSLVRDIHKSAMKRRLVASLVSVCRQANTAVVAEGVETKEEADVLIEVGCDLLQGYYFARPGPAFPEIERH